MEVACSTREYVNNVRRIFFGSQGKMLFQKFRLMHQGNIKMYHCGKTREKVESGSELGPILSSSECCNESSDSIK